MDTNTNTPPVAEECLPAGTSTQPGAVTPGPQESSPVKEPAAVQSSRTTGKDTRTVAIAALVVDESIQQREAHLNEEAVTEYAEALKGGETLPPVIIFEDENGTLVLADGFHRVEACKQAGEPELEAEVREGTRRDALRFAVGANSRHGLRRIARVDHKTVGKYRQEIRQGGSSTGGEFPTSAHVATDATSVATEDSHPTPHRVQAPPPDQPDRPDQPEQTVHSSDSRLPPPEAAPTSSAKAQTSGKDAGTKRASQSERGSSRVKARRQREPAAPLSPDKVLKSYQTDSIHIKKLKEQDKLTRHYAFEFATRAASILSYTFALLHPKEQESIRGRLATLGIDAGGCPREVAHD